MVSEENILTVMIPGFGLTPIDVGDPKVRATLTASLSREIKRAKKEASTKRGKQQVAAKKAVVDLQQILDRIKEFGS